MGRHGQRPSTESQPHVSQHRASRRPGQRYPPEYRGSLRTHLAKRNGHAQPCLQDGTPRLTISRKPHGARSSRQRPRYGPARPAAAPSPHLQEPRQQPQPTQRGGRPSHKQHLNLHPLSGQGGVAPTRCLKQPAATTQPPKPAYRRAGCSGDRGLHSSRQMPRVQGCHTGTSPAAQAASQAQTQALDTGWPQPHNYHTAPQRPSKKRGQDRRTLAPLTGLRGNIPLAASTKSSIPPREAKAKLQLFSWRPKGKVQSHHRSHANTNKGRKGNAHTQIPAFQKGRRRQCSQGLGKKNPVPREQADKSL